jgi:hypothetical protein
MLVAGAASAAAAAGTSTGASANVAAAAECQVDNPKWEVTWTSEDAVTLRQCGGTAGAADTVTDDELPLTGAGAGARVAAGGAAILLGAGAGLVLAARRGRVTFTA